jgi:hypothetical protein
VGRSSEIVRKEGKTMEENRQTELGLSEAQLQEIMGGCDACRWDKVVVTRHTNKSAMYHQLSNIAQHLELHDRARKYRDTAEMHTEAVQRAQQRIDARHPQGEEPANKRQRLR